MFMPLAESVIGLAVLTTVLRLVEWKNYQRVLNTRIEAFCIIAAACYAESVFVTVAETTVLVRIILLLTVGSLLVLIGRTYLEKVNLNSPEFYQLFLLSILGTLYLVIATDTISIYLALELQTLAFYVLAAFLRNNEHSTEAGLKYFVLGSLSSGFLLFGFSILYFLTGTIDLVDYTALFTLTQYTMSLHDLSICIGLLFVLGALLFKIGIAPFHLWIADVYEGSPTVVTAIFATVPKIPLFVLLIKILYSFQSILYVVQPLFFVTGLLSLFFGSLSAIIQKRIKRLLAFSTIAHMGFMCIPLAIEFSIHTITTLFFYLCIYLLMSVLIFTVILSLSTKQRSFTYIADFKQLYSKNTMLAIIITAIFFSMAGVPPLPGFYSKFYLFLHAFNSDAMFLVICALAVTTISAIYYLYIIHTMFFNQQTSSFLHKISKENAATIGVLFICLLFFGIYPQGLLLFCQLWAINGLFL